jgi:small GTP-binding protein
VKVSIFDISGQEDLSGIDQQKWMADYNAYLFVYSINSKQSLDQLPGFKQMIDFRNKNPLALMLVGNKCDLESGRQVTYDEGKAFAEERGMKFLETSAKNNVNVELAFMELVKMDLTTPAKLRGAIEQKSNCSIF